MKKSLLDELTGEVQSLDQNTFVYTWHNYKYAKTTNRSEIPQGISLTIPDMALTRAEVLARHVRKLPVPGFDPVYLNDEVDVSDLINLDRMELLQLARDINDNIAHMQNRAASIEDTKIAMNEEIQKLREDPDSPLSRLKPEETPNQPPAPAAGK